MVDILIAVALLLLGWWLGGRQTHRREPPVVEQRELERLREDRAAFAQLMGYNADRAYGLEDEEGGVG